MRIIKKNLVVIFGVCILALNLCSNVHALPVFPGAEGFGTDTPAGRGGQVIKVTNINASGPGSLRAAIDASGPRVVVFEVSGTIPINSILVVNNPYITIAGQTAPSPGITLKGATLIVNTHDVLIQHLRVRPGDKEGYTPNNRNAISIANINSDVYNVIIDHCSTSWGIDGNILVWRSGAYKLQDVTISNTIISEALHNSIHPDGPHSMALLVGDHVKNTSIIGNLFAHNNERNPLMKGDTSVVIANNVVYNPGSIATYFTGSSGPDLASLVGNVYIPQNSSAYAIDIYSTISDQSKIYISDQLCDSGTDMVCVKNRKGDGIIVDTPPIWVSGYSPRPSFEAKDYVLQNVGARPWDRDSVDDRIINDVINGTGSIIDSQSEVGSWPNLAQNHRSLTIPANPDGDDDGDGYTNLEEWLYSFDAGTGNVPPVIDEPTDPPSPTVSDETVFSSVSSVTGDTVNWEPLNADRWAVVSDGDDLRYGIMTSSYSNLTGSRLGEYSLIKNKTYDDFVFEAKVKSTENFTSNISADYAVLFDYQDSNNYYYMMFNAYASNTELFKIVNGSRQLIATASNLAIPDNTYHVVKIERTGDNINVMFDNTQILEAVDSQFDSGRVGIGSYNDASLWDDITVSEQNVIVQAPSIPQGLRLVTE